MLRMHTCLYALHAYMHTYIHARMHAFMHAYMHARMNTCIHAYMLACIHVYLLACIHARMHACTHARMRACTHACMLSCMHAFMHACFHACMLACLHAYMHACMLAYMHDRMHKRWLSPPQLLRNFVSNPPHPAGTLTWMLQPVRTTAGANGGFHHRSFTETHARPHPHRMHVACAHVHVACAHVHVACAHVHVHVHVHVHLGMCMHVRGSRQATLSNWGWPCRCAKHSSAGLDFPGACAWGLPVHTQYLEDTREQALCVPHDEMERDRDNF